MLTVAALFAAAPAYSARAQELSVDAKSLDISAQGEVTPPLHGLILFHRVHLSSFCSPHSSARTISNGHLIDLILGDRAWSRSGNDLALSRFQAKVRTIRSVEITHDGHVIRHLQRLTIGVDHL
jgi:hypothetical protein